MEKYAPVFVTKWSGEKRPFSDEKVRASLKKAGAATDTIDRIMEELYQQLYPGIPTRVIYRIAFDLLKHASRHVAARYNLKQAIFELGPSGFPFEKFIAELFGNTGFTVTTNVIMEGHCVKHEVDVLAKQLKHTLIIECKYHQQGGTFCDVKTPLYFHARCEDIAQNTARYSGPFEGCLVTNTRFSADALQYGNCAGLQLLSWDYPANKGIKDIIDRSGLYPLTCLTTLSRAEKYRLLEKGIILCSALQAHPAYLDEVKVSPARRGLLMAEIDGLCKKDEFTVPH
ncbi:ATP cone domain-containing protein [Chitinophaga vietnamensis]|uniref:ATP cone domain-containing protein n=1 Tax=Chitinophaga vietnamensis TaxID=2593957 RepID=UPI001177A0F0|nr:ATP cone domain-containing protein [Chitinophaga vietnamensis]